MLTKFLIAVVVLIFAFILLLTIGIEHAGLIALAIAIVAFLVAPTRVQT